MPDSQPTYTTVLNRLFRTLIGITCLVLVSLPCKAQVTAVDTTSAATDTTASVPKQKQDPKHSPRRAVLFSIIPGGGQLYDKKYWKIPVLYAGYAALGYTFAFNQSRYLTYQTAYKNSINGVPDNYSTLYTEDQLHTMYRYYLRNRNYIIAGAVALYVVNLADAGLSVQKPTFHSPKRAAVYSLFPGGGQIYNHKYWKLPIIYVGYAALAYSFQFNQSHYVKYRDALKNSLNGVPDYYSTIYTQDQLETLYKYYHRYRDLTVIGGIALYVLNIVDAAVDAHMYTFNVSDDLSMHVYPTVINTAAGFGHYTGGIGLNIKF